MGIKLKINEMNEVIKGTELFQEGDQVEYICVVLKGRVEIYNKGSRIIFGNGCFLGVQDFYLGHYLGSCVAVDDMVLYVFPAESSSAIERILSINKDYRGLLMYSIVKHINSLYRAREEFKDVAEKTYQWIMECYQEYLKIARDDGMLSAKQTDLEALAPLDTSSPIDIKRLNFYVESAQVPLDVIKSFYGCGIGLTLHPLEQGGNVCTELVVECTKLTDYITALLQCLSGGQGGLLAAVIQLAMRVKGRKGMEEIFKTLNKRADECMDHINEMDGLLVKKTGRKSPVDREKIEKLYVALLTGELPQDGAGNQAKDNPFAALEDSLGQIMKFGGFDSEKSEQFRVLLETFENMEDKSSTEDKIRQLRRGISTLFYELYEAVFLRAVGRKELPKPVELFLNFGYVSEKLLEEDEKRFLLTRLDGKFTGAYGHGRVYTIFEWLTVVYEGKREPSKNEMDMDYTEYLREQRKTNQITDAQLAQLSLNQREKLNYEIKNMFQSNNRLVNGQLSIFVPILHHDMFQQAPGSNMLDCAKIERSVEKFKQVDYSVFYRDVMYSRPDKGIDKIYVMKEYYPDIILMPTVGARTSMWQESSGKRRESAGRFILPLFFEDDLDSAMIKLLGRFRWELCRFLQGGSWNNIKYRSLTSEYCDYIQFYRKNHDLSEEKKEKIKQQIQKAKNNTREVFVIDYELWVRNESAGAVRLNKSARDILAQYCPFAKDVRAKLASQPMFEESMAKAERERAKNLHEIDMRIRQLSKEVKGEIPKEILDTYTYFQNG